ncbi:hypothetical protein D4A39_08265 [Alcanivorax profundi]|uniref:Uncharacterized protein n=1 Tax=Alcanivorax profundi TaxID=2338368 RepID=A0A418XZJ6_9GAMM|nr:hypothetical protein [Alcanivorax profundi]RJG18452.1 hypothetical protein D4A39_08265 [Alcanivorax profundi]
MTKAMLTALVLALTTNTVQAEMTIGKLAEVCSPGGIEYPNAKVPETPEEKFGQAFVSELVGGV